MALSHLNQVIQKVQIIDDDPHAREAYKYTIEDLGLVPISVDGPLTDLSKFVDYLKIDGESVICDHHLSKKNYASFNGAETVAQLYQNGIPAVLHTRYEDVIDEIRGYRRYIPVLLNPDELDPDTLEQGFKQCIGEFNDEYLPSRRPWRTLVRIEDIDEERELLHIIIPGWDPKSVIRLLFKDIPSKFRTCISQQPRFYAKVNIGAEEHTELYLEDWELA